MIDVINQDLKVEIPDWIDDYYFHKISKINTCKSPIKYNWHINKRRPNKSIFESIYDISIRASYKLSFKPTGCFVKSANYTNNRRMYISKEIILYEDGELYYNILIDSGDMHIHSLINDSSNEDIIPLGCDKFPFVTEDRLKKFVNISMLK